MEVLFWPPEAEDEGFSSVSEMECSMMATACEQTSPVLRHCIRGQTVSMSVSEWILTVTRVGLVFPPDRSVPVIMLPFLDESITAPCLKRSLPALLAFHPAALAIHFSVISMSANLLPFGRRGCKLINSLCGKRVIICS